MSLERYVQLSVALVGVDDAARAAVLAKLGSSTREWQALGRKWQLCMASDADVSKRYDELMRQQLRAGCAGAPQLGFDEYVELSALSTAGQDLQPLLDELGLDLRGFYFRGYEWKARFAEDTRLGAYFRIRTMLRAASFGRIRTRCRTPHALPSCGRTSARAAARTR